MRLLLPLVLAAGALAAPVDGAAASCSDATELSPEVEGRYYVLRATVVEIWKETNALPGLQKTDCLAADGSLILKDTWSHDYRPVGNGCIFMVNGSHYCII